MKFVFVPAVAVVVVGVVGVVLLAALVSSIASASVAAPAEPQPQAEAGPGGDLSVVPAATASEGSGRPVGPVDRADTVEVGGIRVHHSIAEDLGDLLAAAAADGVTLGGWGWRDHQGQIRLRREHCGTSEYAVWEMPSSQCSPPTARPGRSQHEYGLAVDFTCNGRPIAGTACFRWLQSRAAEFGFFNLPSEAWHWSTTGQ